MTQFANLLQSQVTESLDEGAFAVEAIGDDVAQVAQIVCRDQTADLSEIALHAAALCPGGRVAGWGLFDTEGVSAVVGDVEPGQQGNFQAPLCTALRAVPEALEAIGVVATFGDEAGIDDQGLFMFGGDRLAQGRLVECDEVKASFVPACQEYAHDRNCNGSDCET